MNLFRISGVRYKIAKNGYEWYFNKYFRCGTCNYYLFILKALHNVFYKF